MELEENKSQIWYKVVDENDSAADNPLENLRPFLPVGDNKGKWYESPIEEGSLLMNNPRPIMKGDWRTYVVEISGKPIKENPGEIYLKRFRLVREATKVELERFRM